MNKYFSIVIPNNPTHIFKNSYLIILMILLEYIQLFNEAIKSINRIVNQGADTNFINAISYINPVHYLQKAQTCTQYNGYNICKYAYVLPLIFFIVVLTLGIIFNNVLFISKKRKENAQMTNSKMTKKLFVDKIIYNLEVFYANYFDLMVHLLSYTIFYFFSNIILNTLYSLFFASVSLDIPYLIFAILGLVLLSAFIYAIVKYIKNFALMIQFDKRISLPYDHLFSRNYDYFLLFYKLMIVTFNNFSNIAERQNSYILDALIAFLPLIFILYLAIKLYTNKILFLINKRYNATRIFLLTFNSVFAIFFICFNYELQNTVNLVFNIIACFCLSLRLTFYFIEINRNKILEGKNVIHQLAYIISARNIEDSNLESDIFKLVLIHKINCEKITKRWGDDSNSRCHICNEQNFTLDNFIRNFYEESKITIEKDNYSKADLEVYELLKLFVLVCFESKNKIKLMITVVRMLSKKKNENEVLNSNVLIFYDFVLEVDNLYDGKFYNIIKIYEETTSLLNKAIYLARSIYEYEEIDLDFHLKAEEILSLRNKIKQNFSNFSKFKDIRCDNFSLIIFKKVYESLFNTILEEYTLELPDNEIKYILDNSYNNDKFIFINYNLQSETLAVTNASKDLNYIKNKNLENYFPQEISSEYKTQFIEKLKLNESDSFTFDFLMRERSANFLIKKVIMKCKIYQSSDSNNLKIVGTYKIKENSFVLLEKDENDPSCAYIRNSSENIAKLLYLPEVFIKYPYNVNLNFYRIFTENNLVDFPLDDLITKEKSKKNIIELNHSYHYALMSTLVSALQGYENDVDEKMVLLKEKANKQVVARFIMKEVKSFKSEKTNYLLLSIKNLKDHKSIKSLNKHSEEENQDNSNEENNSLSLKEKREESLHSLFDSNNNISPASSIKNLTTSKKISLKFQKLEKFRQYVDKSSNLSLLNVLIIILVCALIAYNLIILFLITQNNSNLLVVHEIRQDYLALKSNFYSMYNNVFNGLYLYNDNQTEVIELSNSYYKSINKNPNNTFKFNELTNEELVLKLNIHQSMIQLLQGAYYSSFASKDFEAIFNTEMVYYSISSTNGIIQLNNKNMSLFDSMQTFMNLAKIISEDNFLFVYVVDFKDGIYDFSNINGRDLDANQIYAMELVINFVNYYKMLEFVETKTFSYSSDKIHYNINIFIYFTLSLEAIHVVFVFLCFLQVYSLSRMIDQFTYFISKLMKDDKIKNMKEKLKCLEYLNDLYREHPKKNLKLLEEIREGDSEIKISKKISAKNLSSDEEKDNEILLNKHLKANKRVAIAKKTMLYPLIIFIVIVFSIYYSLSIIFEISAIGANQDFHHDDTVFQKMTNKMDNVMNNLNLAQVNFFTNNTDNSLYNIITVNGTSGTFAQPYFIRGIIDMIASDTIFIEASIQNDPSYYTIALDQGVSVNCTSIYSLVNEPFIMALNQSNPNSNYSIIEYFTDICTGTGVYNEGMDNLINEINYRLSNYLFYYEEQNFNLTNVIAVYNLPIFTELYIAVDMIYVPLKKYLLGLTVSILSDSSNTLSRTITIFIVVNILIDLIILLLVVRRLISGSLKIRQYLYNILEVMIEV